MLELISYLPENGFKTFIVSGGGIEFMRPWTEHVYGIPPEQVLGSSGKTQFKLTSAGPVLLRLPQIEFVDDGPSPDPRPSWRMHLNRRTEESSDDEIEILPAVLQPDIPHGKLQIRTKPRKST
jgi:hypothetical protein